MKKLSLLLALSLVLTTVSGCTTKNDEMEAQLMQHDAQIRQMQPVQADAWNQVQSLREEVQDLRGQLADLRRIGGSAVLVDKLNRHDAALRQIETSMALQFDLGDPIAPQQTGVLSATAAAGTPADPALAQDASLTQASAAGSYGGIADSGAAAPAVAATAAAAATAPASTWGQATPRPEQPKAQKDMTIALYEAGINAFKARKYTEAQRSFSDFLKNYGSDSKAPDAQYYLAECYFQTNQFADAALAYDTVITRYSSSAKAPGAYLKQGICFSKLKQNKAARARMNELIKKYPKSPEAARAKSFLKNNA